LSTHAFTLLPRLEEQYKLAHKLQLCKYLYFMCGLKYQSLKEFEGTMIYKISRAFSDAERVFFEFIDSQLWNKSCEFYIIQKDTLELIEFAQQNAAECISSKSFKMGLDL
jgi:hypothetical protein